MADVHSAKVNEAVGELGFHRESKSGVFELEKFAPSLVMQGLVGNVLTYSHTPKLLSLDYCLGKDFIRVLYDEEAHFGFPKIS